MAAGCSSSLFQGSTRPRSQAPFRYHARNQSGATRRPNSRCSGLRSRLAGGTATSAAKASAAKSISVFVSVILPMLLAYSSSGPQVQTRIGVMRPVLAFLLTVPLFGQKQPFDADTMLRLARISQPELSPSGRQVAFTVQTVDVQKNTKPEQIYVVSVDGGVPRQITQDGTVNERPRWSPDSRQIYYVSNRGGTSQIWVMDADGTHGRQITHIATEASAPMLTADGKNL